MESYRFELNAARMVMEEQSTYYIRFMTVSTGGQRGGGAFQPWKSIIFMSIHYINSSFRHFQRVFPGSHNTSTAKLFLVRWAVRVRCLWQRGKTPASRHSDSVCYKFHGKSAFVGRSPSKASEHRNYCAMFWARISEHFKSAHFGDVN